jgi:prepilin-type N-terminal cleavage/methylation domain-containing protein
MHGDGDGLINRRVIGDAVRIPSPGFTLVELLVVIAIIAMFMVALFPAVQAMRGTARRAHCQNQFLQLIMAAQNHEMAHERFPAGVTDPAPGPVRNVAEGHHHGWVIALLPYLDESNVHRRISADASVYDPANSDARGYRIPKLICPENLDHRVISQSSYAACHHGQEAPIDTTNRGVFYLNSRIMIDDIRDGLSQTIFMGEKLIEANDLGWMSGTRATLRNTGSPVNHEWGKRESEGNLGDSTEPEVVRAEGVGATEIGRTVGEATANSAAARTELTVGGFGSFHPLGAHVAFGDGRIQYMTQQIDPGVYQLLGDRDDGALLQVEDYRE